MQCSNKNVFVINSHFWIPLIAMFLRNFVEANNTYDSSLFTLQQNQPLFSQD